MKEKFIKNIYTDLNYVGIFIVLNIIYLVFSLTVWINLITILIICCIDIPYICVFLLLRNHTMSTIQITNSSISVCLFSKVTCSFNWQDFDDIIFEYRTLGIGAAPVVKFYTSNEYRPAISFDITRKNFSILRKLEKVNTKIKEKIEKTQLTRFGHIKTINNN